MLPCHVPRKQRALLGDAFFLLLSPPSLCFRYGGQEPLGQGILFDPAWIPTSLSSQISPAAAVCVIGSFKHSPYFLFKQIIFHLVPRIWSPLWLEGCIPSNRGRGLRGEQRGALQSMDAVHLSMLSFHSCNQHLSRTYHIPEDTNMVLDFMNLRVKVWPDQ